MSEDLMMEHKDLKQLTQLQQSVHNSLYCCGVDGNGLEQSRQQFRIMPKFTWSMISMMSTLVVGLLAPAINQVDLGVKSCCTLKLMTSFWFTFGVQQFLMPKSIWSMISSILSGASLVVP
ncbi:unnamed protein product [Calypogeia fissa]